MAKIYDFRSGKLRPTKEGDSSLTPSDTPASGRKRAIDKETYLLWMFSKDIDQILARYILEHRLQARELAAVLSHRLGGLVATTENPEKLEEFCESVMRRMTSLEEAEKSPRPEKPEQSVADSPESHDDKGVS